MKNRSRYEIAAAILKTVAIGGTRTKIMYMAMLGSGQCKSYLDSLINTGLVHKARSGAKLVYKLTPKGANYLLYYEQMKALLPLVNDGALGSRVVSQGSDLFVTVRPDAPFTQFDS